MSFRQLVWPVTFLGKSLSVVIIVPEVEGMMLGDGFKKKS
jgi:hypothetical protein